MNIKVFENEEKNKYFNQKGTELVVLTNGKFRVEENIDSMRLVLKGLILESELIETLHKMGITEHTLTDIEEYANKAKEEIDVTIALKAIELYKMLDLIQ